MTDEFLQWLREQLDDDERIARAASDWLKPAAHWSLDEWHGLERPHSLIAQGSARMPVAGGHFTPDPLPTLQAEHIARHDPARVLAEVAAKRELLAQYEHLRHDVMPDDMTGVWAIEAALRALGAVYADRPGYRDEWRP